LPLAAGMYWLYALTREERCVFELNWKSASRRGAVVRMPGRSIANAGKSVDWTRVARLALVLVVGEDWIRSLLVGRRTPPSTAVREWHHARAPDPPDSNPSRGSSRRRCPTACWCPTWSRRSRRRPSSVPSCVEAVGHELEFSDESPAERAWPKPLPRRCWSSAGRPC